MGIKLSGREFLKAAGAAGLLLPAAGCASTKGIKTELQEPPNKIVYRTLGNTGLKVSGVGFGIGFVPVTEVVARALDMGVNYYDTARGVGRQREDLFRYYKGPGPEQDSYCHQVFFKKKSGHPERSGYQPRGPRHGLC